MFSYVLSLVTFFPSRVNLLENVNISTFVALLLLFLSGCPFSMAQTVYDLDEINADLRILGDEGNDGRNRMTVLDFNNNGINDFFIGGWDHLSDGNVYGFLDFNFTKANQFLDLRDECDIFLEGGWYPEKTISLGNDLASGDINGDGVDDLVMSDQIHDYVFCLWGSSEWQTGTTLNFIDNPADITLMYETANPLLRVNLGFDLTVCDLNNDGIQDIVIGAPDALNSDDSYVGGVFVIFGRADFQPLSVINIPDGPVDLTIVGADGGDRLGYCVASGDVNGDGIDDLAVGAYHAEYHNDDCGRVYLIYGSESYPDEIVINLANDSADLEIKGPHAGSWTGRSLSIGDINGDGYGDLCFGASQIDSTPEGEGAAFVIYGRSDFPPHHFINLANEEPDISFHGSVSESFLGSMNNISSGDMDGDGCAEIALGADNSSAHPDDRGVIYVVSGSSAFPPHTIIDFNTDQPALKIFGDDPDDECKKLSDMADINQDGYMDLIFGATGADREDDPYAAVCGETYVILSDGAMLNPPRFVAGPGPDAQNPLEVRFFNPNQHNNPLATYFPYTYSGYGINVAAGDLDGDVYHEILCAPGPGPNHPPLVKGLEPDIGSILFQFNAYGTHKYGVNVDSGDIDGDGIDEILTGAGPGNVFGPHVRGWRWDGDSTVTSVPQVSFLAYGTHRWGVNVSSGDVDGDGVDEIITGAGPGSVFGPHVRSWDWDGGGSVIPDPRVSYLAYGTHKFGVNVTCGDVDGDGIEEIITGPGPGQMFGSHIRGWNYDGDRLNPIEGINFIAYSNLEGKYGAVVACGDVNNDRVDEILTAPGPHPDSPAFLKTWSYDGVEVNLMESRSFLVFEEGDYKAGARIAFGNLYEEPQNLP